MSGFVTSASARATGRGAIPSAFVVRPQHLRAWRIAVAVAALLMVVALWGAMTLAAQAQAQALRDRAARNAGNLAAIFASQLHQQLASLDQTLLALASRWRQGELDLAEPRLRSLLIVDLGEEVIVLDRNGRVSAATSARLSGADLRDRPGFRVLRDQPGAGLYVGPAIKARTLGRVVIPMARRLPDPEGRFVGVLIVTLDVEKLVRGVPGLDLGSGGMLGLIGPGPHLQRLLGTDAGAPDGSIEGTAMLAAAQALPDGIWTGPTALDGHERIHAFRRIAATEPQVVVAADLAAVNAEFLDWQREAFLFGAALTMLILVVATLACRGLGEGVRQAGQAAAAARRFAEAEAETGRVQALADRRLGELRAMIAGTADGVSVLDGELRLVMWNDRFPDIVGAPASILRVGLPMQEILRAQALAGEFGAVEVEAEVARRIALIRRRLPFHSAERVRPGGRVLEVRRTALAGGGCVTVYVDVTSQRLAATAQEEMRRAAEAAMQTRSRFVAVVSHEIRTPLNAVLGALALLDDSGLLPAQKELAARARQAGDGLAHLVSDILEMSKVEGGRLTLRPSIFALRPLLESVIEMFGAEAAARGINLRLDMAPGAPERMMADPGRLRQVLLNLVSNAVKYTVPGTVLLLAQAIVTDGRPALRLAVRDSGPHIGTADTALLFQPFVRLEGAARSGVGGTGLGLAICQRLVELLGGSIGLGAVGAGNEFWVTVPVDGGVVADAAPAADVRPSAMLPRVRRRPPRTRILLVEDVPANQVITATLLRREGHLTDIAQNGPEAIAAVQARPYAVVLMDVFMPGMTGLEAARRIRQLAGPAAVVPIVAVTANVSLEDRAACLEAGMNDMIGKPVRTELLQEALLRHVWPLHAVPTGIAHRVATGPADGPRLDVGRMEDLRANLPAATFPAMVENCLSDLQQRLPALRQALGAGEMAVAVQVAHAMVGVCGSYGLVGMRRRLGLVLQAARAGEAASAAQAGQGLEAELAATIDALRPLLQAA